MLGNESRWGDRDRHPVFPNKEKRVRKLMAVLVVVASVWLPSQARAATPTQKCDATCVAYVKAVQAHNYEVWIRHYEAFLICTRAHESSRKAPYYDDGYNVENQSNHTDEGAYQFQRPTWNGVAAHYGFWWLIGVDPKTASVADQDLMAARAAQWLGARPWSGLCGNLLGTAN